MIDELAKVWAAYGILALGWIIAYFLWQENRTCHKDYSEKFAELYTASTSTMAAIKQLLEERLPSRTRR